MEVERTKWNKELVKQMINYVKTGVPPGNNANARYRFSKRFTDLSEFKIEKKKLFYKDKRIVPEEDADRTLKKFYLSLTAPPNGRERFGELVKNKFIGITKERAFNWLKNLELYQIHKPAIQKSFVNPIVPSEQSKRWVIDLIDMRNFAPYNKNYNWIFMAIDAFTKYIWAQPLKLKAAKEVSKVLEELLDEVPQNKLPSVISSDNGPEFVNFQVTEVLKRYNQITHVTSQPYHPQAQGVIERANQTVKQYIFRHFQLYNTKRWIDVLPKIIDEYNHTYHTVVKQTPVELQKGKGSYKIAKEGIIDQAERIKSYNAPLKDLKVGDWVRIANITQKEARKKAKFRKSFLPQWSYDLYKVVQVTDPKKTYTSAKYTLENSEGELQHRIFYRNQLMKVDKKNLIVFKEQKRPNYGSVFKNEEDKSSKPTNAEVYIAQTPSILERPFGSTRATPALRLKDFFLY